MKHAIKPIRFIGMVDPSRKQDSRLRDATGREDRRMPIWGLPTGEEKR